LLRRPLSAALFGNTGNSAAPRFSVQDHPAIKKWVKSYCKPSDAACNWNNPSEEYDKEITLDEARAINLISGIGSEQSKHNSGLIIRTFNDAQIGLVFAYGGISIGDNDTFTKIVDTSVAQLARRVLERQLYDYFSSDVGENSDTQGFIKIIGSIFENLDKKKADEKISP